MAQFEDTLEQLYFPDRASWRAWLAENQATSSGIWFLYYKKHTGQPSVAYPDVVKECLCFGWIDSKIKTIDDQRYRQIITPRKPRSVWSKLNKSYIEELQAAGLLAPSGLAKIEAAKADGSWTTLDAVEAGLVPDDLQAALESNPAALERFTGLSLSKRKLILYSLQAAKRPETRQARLAQALESLTRGQ